MQSIKLLTGSKTYLSLLTCLNFYSHCDDLNIFEETDNDTMSDLNGNNTPAEYKSSLVFKLFLHFLDDL